MFAHLTEVRSMSLKAVTLALASFMAVCTPAWAVTVPFLPSNGAFTDGVFEFQLNGLAGQTAVTFKVTATPAFSCVTDPRVQQTPNCPFQSFAANLVTPEGGFAEVSAASQIVEDNYSPKPGPSRGYSLIDGFTYVLTPESDSVIVDYDFVNGASSIATMLFEVTFAEGQAVALQGDLLKGGPTDTIPIPAALPLLAAGLGGLGFLARKKRLRGLPAE
jgi:hypothetical protein